MSESEVAVRERLAEDEHVLATGRCADITTTGDLDSAGAGWTYVMVTSRHVHWVPSIRDSSRSVRSISTKSGAAPRFIGGIEQR